MILLFLNISLFIPGIIFSQSRSGAAFLKILPGSRQQGLAASLTGAIDEMQSIYANPGATGFLREWQWSATYTQWFADIYNVSVNYGRQICTPWSRHSRFALGINYLGMREFDSTLRNRSAVSASDILFTASMGSPFNVISKNISLGANVKYLRSELSYFTASTFVYDVGILFRSNRVNLNNDLLEYGIFSAGAAITQLGNSLKFKAMETPLPQTLRVGAALNLGSHHGLQIKLVADYKKIKDEIGRFSCGSEISLGYRFALRMGYNFNDHLLSKLSFGLSIRLDDNSSTIQKKVLGRNNALRFDMAGLENNEIFSSSYHGSITHYTIGPEKFNTIQPSFNDTLKSGATKFVWQVSSDPDLFDEVKYYLLIEKTPKIDPNQTQLFRFLRQAKSGNIDIRNLIEQYRSEFFLIEDSTFFFNKALGQIAHTIQNLPAGDYFWTVIAHDKDYHFRIARNNIRYFHILWPDIKIRAIEFEPSPWITESDTQGVINVTVENREYIPAEHVSLTISAYPMDGNEHTNIIPDTIYQDTVSVLAAQQSHRYSALWRTRQPGLYKFHVTAQIIEDKGCIGKESDMSNNDSSATFYTIPKGKFVTQDTIKAFIIPYTHCDIPFVSRIFFNLKSSIMSDVYFNKTNFLYAQLKKLVARLKKRPGLYIGLEGFADSVSGETLELAKKRVEAVRNVLINMGVSPIQIPPFKLSWGISKYKKPSRNLDVLEERRYVKITSYRFDTHKEDDTLLEPIPFETVKGEPHGLPIPFLSSITGVVPAKKAHAIFRAESLTDTLGINYAVNKVDSVSWLPGKAQDNSWMKKQVSYNVIVKDTLNRTFKTRVKKTYLAPLITHSPLVVGLAEFNNPKPFLIIRLSKLVYQLKLRLKYDKKAHIRFIGHACGIPPISINNKYSNMRAQKFQELFLKEVEKYRQRDPELSRLIKERLDTQKTIGKGSSAPYSLTITRRILNQNRRNFVPESYQTILRLLNGQKVDCDLAPFTYKIENGKIKLTGDNSTPQGRQINRRIELDLYYP